jgi:hypothetical protein
MTDSLSFDLIISYLLFLHPEIPVTALGHYSGSSGVSHEPMVT